jgi:alpha,alpha-trehalase
MAKCVATIENSAKLKAMPVTHMRYRGVISILVGALLLCPATPFSESKNHSSGEFMSAQPDSLGRIQDYISHGWDHLTRSLTDCRTFTDVKTDNEPVLYLPAELHDAPLVTEMQKQCKVRVDHLPEKITRGGDVDVSKIQTEGLLYLEHPYVVPGGQFNEMYGWDSYFIIRGLVRDDRVELAKGMVEDFFFEIEHYGDVLNANRTYYLTRSQPPFLTSMILAVYENDKPKNAQDLQWLQKAYDYAVRDYEQWIQSPHLAGDTGLSRYFDHGDGPVPEIAGGPSFYYRGVAQFFYLHGGANEKYLVRVDEVKPAPKVLGSIFEFPSCRNQAHQFPAPPCDEKIHLALSAEYYKGDRSMRESGFDVSFRFGPFSADTHHYAPVCLNSLLYTTEKNLEKISQLLGRPSDVQHWNQKAAERRAKIDKYFWDEKEGMYFDYDFTTQRRSDYKYATTFYPLWAGLATKEQADAVMRNLPFFEEPGGIVMSKRESQTQWDYPYGWAPIHLLAVEAMRQYGYEAEANRISYKFLSMVMQNFERDNTIREKYDVVNRSAKTHIVEGYKRNVIGFGWTNGVFLELAHQLPPEFIARLRKQ